MELSMYGLCTANHPFAVHASLHKGPRSGQQICFRATLQIAYMEICTVHHHSPVHATSYTGPRSGQHVCLGQISTYFSNHCKHGHRQVRARSVQHTWNYPCMSSTWNYPCMSSTWNYPCVSCVQFTINFQCMPHHRQVRGQGNIFDFEKFQHISSTNASMNTHPYIGPQSGQHICLRKIFTIYDRHPSPVHTSTHIDRFAVRAT